MPGGWLERTVLTRARTIAIPVVRMFSQTLLVAVISGLVFVGIFVEALITTPNGDDGPARLYPHTSLLHLFLSWDFAPVIILEP